MLETDDFTNYILMYLLLLLLLLLFIIIVLLIINIDWKYFWHITNYINFNVTQQDTQRNLPDSDVHTSKHVGAVESINKSS
jgi:hypothetical protein